MPTIPRNSRRPSTPGDLTARYVHAATRRLGEEQRDDVARELGADIADRVDALLAQDPTLTEGEAERAALVELGDPEALAASYAGTRQYLIGPETFVPYVRSLKAITVVAVPAAVAVIVLIDALRGEPPLDILGRAAWLGFTMAVHIAFWVTLAFAIVERSNDVSSEDLGALGGSDWEPEQLPELPAGPPGSLSETVCTVAWIGILAGFVVLQQVGAGDERIPVLDPDLWSFWLPLVLLALAAEAVFEVVKYRAGAVWTPRFAVVNTVTALLLAAPVAWLAWQEKLLNPAFTRTVQEGWPEFDPGVAHVVVLVTALVVWAWDTADGWRRTLRP